MEVIFLAGGPTKRRHVMLNDAMKENGVVTLCPIDVSFLTRFLNTK